MGDVDQILGEVRALADRGDHQAIVERYGTVDDLPEDDAWHSTELLFEIGRAFGMLGNEDKLERYLQRCAELSPRRAAVFHCAIGWFFQRKKKWTKALRWYDRALVSFPTYHLCLFRRGYCLEKLHRPRESVEALTRARAVWDEAPPEQRQRGRGVQVQVLFHLSRTLRDLGDFEDATDTLVACQELDAQTDPPAIQREHVLACEGELELRRGNLDDALRCFEGARDLDPESSYLWERIGRVRELQGRMEMAGQAYDHAARLPQGAFALFALGRFHINVTNNLPAGGRALVEALARLRSAEPLVRLELARLQLACSRPNAALVQIERALACRREGGFAEGLRLAADLSARLGRPGDAARYLRQLAPLVPEAGGLLERADALDRGEGLPPGAPPKDSPLPAELQFLNETEISTPGRERVNGIVDRFMAEKGFGFLRYGENQSLFFHVTQCEDDAREMAPGTRVSFVVGHNPKKGKPQAESVRRDH